MIDQCIICSRTTQHNLCPACARQYLNSLDGIDTSLSALDLLAHRLASLTPHNTAGGHTRRANPLDPINHHYADIYEQTVSTLRLIAITQGFTPKADPAELISQLKQRHQHNCTPNTWQQVVSLCRQLDRELTHETDRVLLGICPTCNNYVAGYAYQALATCPTCGTLTNRHTLQSALRAYLETSTLKVTVSDGAALLTACGLPTTSQQIRQWRARWHVQPCDNHNHYQIGTLIHQALTSRQHPPRHADLTKQLSHPSMIR